MKRQVLTKFFYEFAEYPYGNQNGEIYAKDKFELGRELKKINKWTGEGPDIKIRKIIQEVF